MCDGQKIYNKWINLLVMQWRMNQAFKHEIEVKFRVNLWLSSFVECHRLLDEMKESVNYLNSHNVNVIEFEKMVFFSGWWIL